MEFKQASYNDIDLFLEHRMEFVASIRNIEDSKSFKEGTRKYLEEHIDKEDLIIFIAKDGEKIVSSCMACIFETIPLPSCPKGKSAELLNVYTLEGWRRYGYAEKLIHMLMIESKKRGVEKIILDYTDAGLPLYKKLGFIPLEYQMQMKL
jgi:ribosomal protein S18 acetylase RimI-like enzyme